MYDTIRVKSNTKAENGIEVKAGEYKANVIRDKTLCRVFLDGIDSFITRTVILDIDSNIEVV